MVAREQLAITAARIAPPPYVVAELGQRPTDPAEAKTWNRGPAVIETYRRDNAVTDRASAFGPAAKSGTPAQGDGAHRAVQRQLREVAVRQRVRERSVERRSFGMVAKRVESQEAVCSRSWLLPSVARLAGAYLPC